MSLITVAGYAAVLYVLAKLLTYLSKYVRSPLNVSKLGDWSLVTGATDGIGENSNLGKRILLNRVSVQARGCVRSWLVEVRTLSWSAEL